MLLRPYLLCLSLVDMVNDGDFGRQLRKCGGCGKHVATRLNAQAGELFVAHLDRGRLCVGSNNAAVANVILAQAARS